LAHDDGERHIGMKRIEAIIRPERLEAVKESLVALGHAGLTVTEVKGHGIQKGITQQWRGQEYTIDLLPKVSVMAVVNDHEVADVIAAIEKAARTDRIGDGKIFVSPIEQVVRIRTGESGTDAL
jgi:nitrogen regulatory protein PII